MDLPSKSDSVWMKVITGEKTVAFSHLGIKVLLGRLMNSTDDIEKKVDELHALFQENIHVPKVQDDLKKMLG